MERGAWQATVHEVAKELDATYQLNNNKYIYIYTYIDITSLSNCQTVLQNLITCCHRNSSE